MIRHLRHPSQIREWAEERGIHPALTEAGELQLVAPGGEARTSLTWEEFAGLSTVLQLGLFIETRMGTEAWRMGSIS